MSINPCIRALTYSTSSTLQSFGGLQAVSLDGNASSAFLGINSNPGETLEWGGLVIAPMGLVKLNSCGIPQWVAQPSDTFANISISDNTTDSAEASFLVGGYSGLVTLGSFELPAGVSFETQNVYVAGVDETGAFDFATPGLAGSTLDVLTINTVAETGSTVLAAGDFAGEITMGSITLTANEGDYDSFIFGISKTTGLPFWATQLGITGTTTDQEYTIDMSANAGYGYLLGGFEDEVVIGSTTFTATPPFPYGGGVFFDAFVAKIDASDGSWGWARHIQRATQDAVFAGSRIETNSKCSSSYVSGNFGGQIVFTPTLSVTVTTPFDNGDLFLKGSFVAKLNQNGAYCWVNEFVIDGTDASGFVANSSGNANLSSDACGNVYYSALATQVMGNLSLYHTKANGSRCRVASVAISEPINDILITASFDACGRTRFVRYNVMPLGAYDYNAPIFAPSNKSLYLASVALGATDFDCKNVPLSANEEAYFIKFCQKDVCAPKCCKKRC